MRADGRWRLHGHAANAAQRVQDAGKGKDDPVLLSDSVVARLPSDRSMSIAGTMNCPLLLYETWEKQFPRQYQSLSAGLDLAASAA